MLFLCLPTPTCQRPPKSRARAAHEALVAKGRGELGEWDELQTRHGAQRLQAAQEQAVTRTQRHVGRQDIP
jgi:hypothetical protein